MSAALDHAPPDALRDEAGGPGETHIEDGVVEKIASRAAGEVDDVGGVAGRVLGVRLGSGEPDRDPSVRARVDGTIVTLHVTLSVTYPAPVAEVTQRVRAHVVERVSELTGLRPRQVDISVAALHRHGRARRELA
jgi:uncharacterized alkaline shock family protein YloU